MCSYLLILVNLCSQNFVYLYFAEKNDVHNLPLHRQSVLNVQQDFTVLAHWMLTLGMCLGHTLPCCVLKDIIAHQVGYKCSYSNTFMTNVRCYQI